MKKRIISLVIVLALALCAFPLSAFADNANESPDAEVMYEPWDETDKDGTDIVMRQHTDVIIRERPTVHSKKLDTLYVGDVVHIIDWKISRNTVDGYYWARIRHYNADTQKTIYGYSANSLLS